MTCGSSGGTTAPSNYDRPALLDSELDIANVSYLGPVSSYTHQVHTLVQSSSSASIISLTKFNLAQAALQCFDSTRYKYKPAVTIPGCPNHPLPYSLGII